MQVITRFTASNGHTGQVKHNKKLSNDEIIALIKRCYRHLSDKSITL